MLILTKADLVPSDIVERWKVYFNTLVQMGQCRVEGILSVSKREPESTKTQLLSLLLDFQSTIIDSVEQQDPGVVCKPISYDTKIVKKLGKQNRKVLERDQELSEKVEGFVGRVKKSYDPKKTMMVGVDIYMNINEYKYK